MTIGCSCCLIVMFNQKKQQFHIEISVLVQQETKNGGGKKKTKGTVLELAGLSEKIIFTPNEQF